VLLLSGQHDIGTDESEPPRRHISNNAPIVRSSQTELKRPHKRQRPEASPQDQWESMPDDGACEAQEPKSPGDAVAKEASALPGRHWSNRFWMLQVHMLSSCELRSRGRCCASV